MSLTLLLLPAGLVILLLGAEALVRGSGSLALRLGISPLIVGITIVAFGTSSPELVVSIRSAQTGSSGIALGNVIGSNICNIALILGISALIRPLKVQIHLVRLDIPIMIGSSILIWVFLANGMLTRIEGVILFVLICAYVIYNVYLAGRERGKTQANIESEVAAYVTKPALSIVLAVLGFVFLLIGARMFVQGSIIFAEWLNLPAVVIGLTIVALGTSLPELATSAVAAFRGAGDISIGNVIGSNIFNILGILGLTAITHPLESTSISLVDLAVMTGVACITLPVMRSGYLVSRVEGFALILIYLIYNAYLVVHALL